MFLFRKNKSVQPSVLPKSPHPLRGWTNLGLFEVRGQNPSTGRQNKRIIEALTADDALSKALHATPEYLMGWSNEIEVSNLFKIEKKKFRLLGNIACGEPIFANEQMDLYVESGAAIEADFCLNVGDDSMIGARIHDGDIVFIRQQDMVNNGEIAAVLIEDKATLRRVYYDQEAGVLSLFAENSQYKTMRFSGEELEHIRILGKAVAFQSDIR